MTWWRFFPNLKTLDLSHNFISTIDLDPSANLWETEDVKLDLTYNNLTELTRGELELIAGIPNIFVDILRLCTLGM
jgi:Leucine-rich repeat (LRR) protein